MLEITLLISALMLTGALILLPIMVVRWIDKKTNKWSIRKKKCLTCNNIVTPETKIAGNGPLEIFLWLCAILPGLLYSINRHLSAKKVCPECGSDVLQRITKIEAGEIKEKKAA